MAAQAQDGSLTIRVCNAGMANSPVITAEHPFYETYALIQQSEQNGDAEADGEPCDMGTAPAATLHTAHEFTASTPQITPQNQAPTALTGIFPSGLPPSTGPPAS